MKKKRTASRNYVMKVHGIVFSLTCSIPLLCWGLGFLSLEKSLALAGIGLFILSGHTIAFFNHYLDYLMDKGGALALDERDLRRFLRLGILLDFSLAFFFYTQGMK